MPPSSSCPNPATPFRFRLASLLIGTAIVAFVVYATVQPSVWAASFGFTVAVVVLSLALVRALVNSGRSRSYWLAFGFAGFAYLGSLYTPVIDERVGMNLVTTVGYAHIEGLLRDRDSGQNVDSTRNVRAQRGFAIRMYQGGLPAYRNPSQTVGSSVFILPQETWAARAFHSMFAIVCGIVAGWVVMLPARREFKDDTAAGGVVE